MDELLTADQIAARYAPDWVLIGELQIVGVETAEVCKENLTRHAERGPNVDYFCDLLQLLPDGGSGERRYECGSAGQRLIEQHRLVIPGFRDCVGPLH